VRHSLTAQTALAFGGGILTACVILLQSWLHPVGAAVEGGMGRPIGISASALFLGVLYTTVLAPIILGLLSRSKNLFAFTPNRRGTRLG
jgi:hypothetical protein